MKASTLVVLIVLYAIAGSIWAAATGGAAQGWTAFATGVGVALALGAAWPVHRGFPIAGFLLGLAMAAFILAWVLWIIFEMPLEIRLGDGAEFPLRPDSVELLVRGLVIAASVFGAWMFFVTVGAGASWLWQRLAPRREVPLEA